MTDTSTARFHFSEEQQQFRDYLRRFLADTSPTAAVRRVMETDTGFDRAVWQRFAAELSLPGLCIPEAYGGGGFGTVELGIAMEEMGRALYPSPFFASAVLAAKTLEHVATTEQRAAHLPGIAQGTTTATLAYMETADHLGDLQCRARNDRITGCKRYVLDGATADLILVVTRSAEGDAVYLVERGTPGLSTRPVATIDQTRRLAEVHLDDVPGERLGNDPDESSALTRVLDLAYIALANECTGGAERLFEDTLEYTKLRRQFGRSIASFQAIKHRMAELLLTVELAKSAAYFAAEAQDNGAHDVSMLASLAKAGASEAYVRTAQESIQLHGGIGFTWENDTHLWYKRAKGSEVFLGDPPFHRRRMIRALVEQEAA